MKQQIVPTSPQSVDRQSHVEAKARRQAAAPHLVFGVVVATLLLGSVAGFLGFVIASNIPASWPVIGRLNVVSWLEQERQDLLLSVRTPGRAVVQQTPQVIDQIVTVYSGEPTIHSSVERIGNAVALTSDGWLAVPTQVLNNAQPVVTEAEGVQPVLVSFVLSNGDVVTDIDQRVDDSFSGMSYLKIPADTLAPVDFTADELLAVGQTVSVVEKDIGSYVVYRHQAAGELGDATGLRSTNRLEQLVGLDTGADSRLLGAPVYTATGELAGVMLTDGAMLSSVLLEGALNNLVVHQRIDRPAFEIVYTNIARLTGPEKQRNALPESGLYIDEVVADQSIGLEAGDVIRSVNSHFVEGSDDLGVVIHSQAIGSVIYFSVLRDGVEESVAVTVTGSPVQ